MFSRVTEAQYRASVDKDVRGTVRGGSADAVGTAGAAMGVAGAMRLVSDSANWGHEISVRSVHHSFLLSPGIPRNGHAQVAGRVLLIK